MIVMEILIVLLYLFKVVPRDHACWFQFCTTSLAKNLFTLTSLTTKQNVYDQRL